MIVIAVFGDRLTVFRAGKGDCAVGDATVHGHGGFFPKGSENGHIFSGIQDQLLRAGSIGVVGDVLNNSRLVSGLYSLDGGDHVVVCGGDRNGNFRAAVHPLAALDGLLNALDGAGDGDGSFCGRSNENLRLLLNHRFYLSIGIQRIDGISMGLSVVGGGPRGASHIPAYELIVFGLGIGKFNGGIGHALCTAADILAVIGGGQLSGIVSSVNTEGHRISG